MSPQTRKSVLSGRRTVSAGSPEDRKRTTYMCTRQILHLQLKISRNKCIPWLFLRWLLISIQLYWVSYNLHLEYLWRHRLLLDNTYTELNFFSEVYSCLHFCGIFASQANWVQWLLLQDVGQKRPPKHERESIQKQTCLPISPALSSTPGALVQNELFFVRQKNKFWLRPSAFVWNVYPHFCHFQSWPRLL